MVCLSISEIISTVSNHLSREDIMKFNLFTYLVMAARMLAAPAKAGSCVFVQLAWFGGLSGISARALNQ